MTADRQGGTRNEAEVEAVARAIQNADDPGNRRGWDWRTYRPQAIAALDAVRSSGSAAEWEARYVQQKQRADSLEAALNSAEAALARSSGSAAQNHEEANKSRVFSSPERSPQDENHEHEWVDVRNSAVRSGEVCLSCGAVRPGGLGDIPPIGSEGDLYPQDEDHEADERALDTPLGARQRAQTQRDVADILSSVPRRTRTTRRARQRP